MPKYQITINLSFNSHHWDDVHSTYDESRKEAKARKAAFERTDAYYEKYPVEDYIKANNTAMGMVECIFCDAEVLSAEWDKQTFAIHMVVESKQTTEELREDLEMNSLEDGEYEACGESGWILFTRGPKGEVFYGGEGSDDVWEYGLVDYRENPIDIKEMIDRSPLDS
jgi:hypothetical protein